MTAGRGGRVAGTPNRDKAELRALLQEKVHEYTELRRQQDIEAGVAAGLSPAEAAAQAQEIVDDYDPVVAMAVTAVDRRTPLDTRVKCNAEVARYVRPQLKSIEVQTDAATAEDIELRGRLAAELMDVVQDIKNAAREGQVKRSPF
jgi:hypothetical protein